MSEQPVRLPPRSLLLPLALLLLIGAATAAGAYWSHSRAHTTVVILLNQADSESASSDPGLTETGQRSAASLGEYLSRMLGEEPIDHIYASDGRPAQQTAAPIANQFKLPINLLADSDWEDLPGRVNRQHLGQYVAVVGSRAQIDTLAKALLGVAAHADTDDFGGIRVIVLGRPAEDRIFYLSYPPSSESSGPEKT
jgi:phosphohistidine phosphatase SixA